MALTSIILPAIKSLGKQCKALLPGFKLKKSPVAMAEFTIACFESRIFFGLPVDPEVLTNILSSALIHSIRNSPAAFSLGDPSLMRLYETSFRSS